ncbi:hypothetical protein RHSIM_Rhsim08G0029300 [Rhododendron simsii]|uniref:Uncharacterized protein n=1 Tax=Rhododendron simsii TaxID=118357 RepID=A0A834GMW4_RHOSS|nr:hypothetical protein RHSIM_Rhsim08G0029300 [Rhododendron simsii]
MLTSITYGFFGMIKIKNPHPDGFLIICYMRNYLENAYEEQNLHLNVAFNGVLFSYIDGVKVSITKADITRELSCSNPTACYDISRDAMPAGAIICEMCSGRFGSNGSCTRFVGRLGMHSLQHPDPAPTPLAPVVLLLDEASYMPFSISFEQYEQSRVGQLELHRELAADQCNQMVDEIIGINDHAIRDYEQTLNHHTPSKTDFDQVTNDDNNTDGGSDDVGVGVGEGKSRSERMPVQTVSQRSGVRLPLHQRPRLRPHQAPPLDRFAHTQQQSTNRSSIRVLKSQTNSISSLKLVDQGGWSPEKEQMGFGMGIQ